jgi:hypothetical protein
MVSMADVMNNQRITADNVNSLADNSVLQTEILRLQTKLENAEDELNGLWDDRYVPRSVENEVKTKESLLKSRQEVERLQVQRNKLEENLYQLQTSKEKLEHTLKKQDVKYVEATTRAAKAEGRVTVLQEELDRVKTSAKTLVVQLESAQRSENVKGSQVSNLQTKIRELESGIAQDMKQIDDLGDEIGELNDRLKEEQEHREDAQRLYNELAQTLLAAREELVSNKESWEQKLADGAREVERLKSEQILARQMAVNMMAVNSEVTIDTLRHQLNAAREEASRQAAAAQFNALRYRGPLEAPQTPMDVPDSSRYRSPIDTPQVMTVGSDVGMDEPHPPNYYHIGSAADPGYNDSMRSAMSGSDLYTGSMGGSTLNNSTSSTLPLTPSVYRRQVKLGSNFPLFKGSRVRVQGMYDLNLIGTNRSRSFSGTTAPHLKGSRFTAAQVHDLISHIQSLLRADAYDETCLERLIDAEARGYLNISFTPLTTMKRHPTRDWQLDWDVAIFIEALEEACSLDSRDKHLGIGQRWIDVALRVQSTVHVQNHDMAALRNNLVAAVNNARYTIGDIPSVNLLEALKILRKCFTCSENPWKATQANRQFKRKLDELIDNDREYRVDPNLGGHLYNLTMLIAEWERDHQTEVLRSEGASTQVGSTHKQKQVNRDTTNGKSQATSSETIDGTIQCEGCGRRGQLRSNCHHTAHPDFNPTGLWKDCKAYRELQAFYLRVKGRRVDFPFLHKTKRADGSDGQPAAVPTPQPTPHRSNTNPATQPAQGGRGNGGKGGKGNGGKYGPGKGGGRVHFEDSGTYNRTDTITHLTCNCGSSDEDITYRQCLVSLHHTTTFFTALTLFDTGAYTSFVNREVVGTATNAERRRDAV